MKIKELKQLETEILKGLKNRFDEGDISAATIILEHLRGVSVAIDKWKRNKTKEETLVNKMIAESLKYETEN